MLWVTECSLVYFCKKMISFTFFLSKDTPPKRATSSRNDQPQKMCCNGIQFRPEIILCRTVPVQNFFSHENACTASIRPHSNCLPFRPSRTPFQHWPSAYFDSTPFPNAPPLCVRHRLVENLPYRHRRLFCKKKSKFHVSASFL